MDFNSGRDALLVRQVIAYGVSVLGMALIPTFALAESDFDAAIEAGVTYTDNIALATIDEESEIVYRAAPSLSYTQNSARISAVVDYRLDAFHYSDLSESDVYHQFDGNVEVALIPQNLFLNIGATRYQDIKDPDAKIPNGNLPISSNRVDRDEFYVMPTFQFAMGRSVTMQGDYRLSWVEYDESDIDNVDQHATGNFVMENYRRGTGLTWATRYRWQRTEYDAFAPWEYQQASVELGFWTSKNLRVFASGGKESAWDMPLESSMDDSFWEAGFATQIGEGFSAEIAAGERTFGSSWRGNLNFEFKNGNTSLQYTEAPTTAGRSAFNPGRFRAPDDPNDFLVRPGSGQRYVRKRFQWNLNFDLRNSNIGLVVFDGRQTDRTEADGTPLADADQRGLNVKATWQVGVKTDLAIGGAWSEREIEGGDTIDRIRASVAAGYRLGSRTRLSLNYQYAEEDGDVAVGSSRDYVSNSATLLISRTF